MSSSRVQDCADSTKTTNQRNFPLSCEVSLGAGNYWTAEQFIREDFQKRFPNTIGWTQVGFMSPDPNNPIKEPSPEDADDNGFVQVVNIGLREPEQYFEELIRFFFLFHDPTMDEQQGKDRGFQYSSYIFCTDEKQFEIASKVKDELQKRIDCGTVVTGSSFRCYRNETVKTRIVPATHFYESFSAYSHLLSRDSQDWEYWNTSAHHMRMENFPEPEHEEENDDRRRRRLASVLGTVGTVGRRAASVGRGSVMFVVDAVKDVREA